MAVLIAGQDALDQHYMRHPDELFERRAEATGETDRDRTLARTVDELRSRFGRDAVLPGRIVHTRPSRTSDPDPPDS